METHNSMKLGKGRYGIFGTPCERVIIKPPVLQVFWCKANGTPGGVEGVVKTAACIQVATQCAVERCGGRIVAYGGFEFVNGAIVFFT